MDEEAAGDESQMGVRGAQLTPGDLCAVGRYVTTLQPWDWKVTRKERWDAMALEVLTCGMSSTHAAMPIGSLTLRSAAIHDDLIELVFISSRI